MTRREAREAILELLFESGFHTEESPEAIFERALEMREIQVNDFVKKVYFGVFENIEFTLDKILQISALVMMFCVIAFSISKTDFLLYVAF